MSDAPDSPSSQGPPPRPLAALALAMAAILLVGLSLRIPMISLSPLLPSMMDDTGHGETFVSLLTSVPLALTLAAAPVAPMLANRLGRSRTVGLSLIAIVVGMIIRSAPGDAPLLIGTGLLGFSIAIVTVLSPSIISAERSAVRSGLTGVYSMSLSLGPALALAPLSAPSPSASASRPPGRRRLRCSASHSSAHHSRPSACAPRDSESQLRTATHTHDSTHQHLVSKMDPR
ncbi:CynX/NimT family MFS transporter [Brevibacterium oceani]|uniref:MFS transporter n=1 Tax=Brevibacterium oceani TaxID=358099 RepID=UPI001B3254BA|nr:MFS transporter [Brevibacterium oceani]